MLERCWIPDSDWSEPSYLVCSDLLLHHRGGAPHNVGGNQSLGFFSPVQYQGQSLVKLLKVLLSLEGEAGGDWSGVRNRKAAMLSKHPFSFCLNILRGFAVFTFLSRVVLPSASLLVWEWSSVSLPSVAPSCRARRGFCSPNSCTAMSSSDRAWEQSSSSSRRVCVEINTEKRFPYLLTALWIGLRVRVLSHMRKSLVPNWFRVESLSHHNRVHLKVISVDSESNHFLAVQWSSLKSTFCWFKFDSLSRCVWVHLKWKLLIQSRILISLRQKLKASSFDSESNCFLITTELPLKRPVLIQSRITSIQVLP